MNKSFIVGFRTGYGLRLQKEGDNPNPVNSQVQELLRQDPEYLATLKDTYRSLGAAEDAQKRQNFVKFLANPAYAQARLREIARAGSEGKSPEGRLNRSWQAGREMLGSLGMRRAIPREPGHLLNTETKPKSLLELEELEKPFSSVPRKRS